MKWHPVLKNTSLPKKLHPVCQLGISELNIQNEGWRIKVHKRLYTHRDLSMHKWTSQHWRGCSQPLLNASDSKLKSSAPHGSSIEQSAELLKKSWGHSVQQCHYLQLSTVASATGMFLFESWSPVSRAELENFHDLFWSSHFKTGFFYSQSQH